MVPANASLPLRSSASKPQTGHRRTRPSSGVFGRRPFLSHREPCADSLRDRRRMHTKVGAQEVSLILRVDFQFNAAHRLPFYDGPCRRTHGHNYRLRVFVEGHVDPKTGIAVDFAEVKRIVHNHVLDAIDHNDLNRVLVNPTAENVVAWMWQRLQPSLAGLTELRLFETEDAGVIYRGEPTPAPELVTAQAESDERPDRQTQSLA